MHRVFVVTDKSRSFAVRYFRCWFPWVTVVARATSGFYGFESRDDYRLWKLQR